MVLLYGFFCRAPLLSDHIWLLFRRRRGCCQFWIYHLVLWLIRPLRNPLLPNNDWTLDSSQKEVSDYLRFSAAAFDECLRNCSSLDYEIWIYPKWYFHSYQCTSCVFGGCFDDNHGFHSLVFCNQLFQEVLQGKGHYQKALIAVLYKEKTREESWSNHNYLRFLLFKAETERYYLSAQDNLSFSGAVQVLTEESLAWIAARWRLTPKNNNWQHCQTLDAWWTPGLLRSRLI